jgi:hypothetical protein
MLRCISLSWLPADSILQAVIAPRTSCSAARAGHNLLALATTSSRSLLRVAGTAAFAVGSVHQYACHRILRNLRARAQTATSRTSEYGIPRGDWFEHVSCAHYLVRSQFPAPVPAIANSKQLHRRRRLSSTLA